MNSVRDAQAAWEPERRPPLKGYYHILGAHLGPLTTALLACGPEYGGASRRISLMDSGALKAVDHEDLVQILAVVKKDIHDTILRILSPGRHVTLKRLLRN